MFGKSRVIEDSRDQTDVVRLPEAGSPEPGFETSGAPADLPQADRWPPLPGSPQLGELLVQKQFVTHAQVSEALLQQPASGKRLGTLLVELGVLDERNLAATVADQLGLPLADLSRQTPEPGALSLRAVASGSSLRAPGSGVCRKPPLAGCRRCRSASPPRGLRLPWRIRARRS